MNDLNIFNLVRNGLAIKGALSIISNKDKKPSTQKIQKQAITKQPRPKHVEALVQEGRVSAAVNKEVTPPAERQSESSLADRYSSDGSKLHSKHKWRGKRLIDMTHQELIHAVVEANNMLIEVAKKQASDQYADPSFIGDWAATAQMKTDKDDRYRYE